MSAGSPGLSYLGFHAVFVLPPLAVLAVAVPALPPRRRRVARTGVALMVTAAVLYTTPWDNFLIARGVWSYGPGTVAVRFGHVPLGEYLFFVLQTVIAAGWLYVVGFDPRNRSGDWARWPRVGGAAWWLAVAAAGGWLVIEGGRGYYLGAILAWAAPLLALQWAVGGAYLRRTWPTWGVAVVVPTLYLWFADRVAIGLGVWRISPDHSTGLSILGLPVEEAAFFLVTSLLVVWGLVLFEWVIDAWR